MESRIANIEQKTDAAITDLRNVMTSQETSQSSKLAEIVIEITNLKGHFNMFEAFKEMTVTLGTTISKAITDKPKSKYSKPATESYAMRNIPSLNTDRTQWKEWQ